MPKYTLQSLLDIMAKLRSEQGCPWDKQQTHDSLTRYLLEEAYEVIDAIEEKTFLPWPKNWAICSAADRVPCPIGAESGKFTMDDVTRHLRK